MSSPNEAAGLLASAVAGRPLRVVATADARSWTDGQVIHASADGGLDAVVVQASLVAAGSLHPGLVKLVGRPASRARYLTLEARRAATVVGDVAPRAVLARVDALGGGARSGSSEESLRRARSARVPEAPAWCGEIRPAAVLRRPAAAVDGGLPRATEGPGLDRLEDDEASDADRSRILDLLAAPLRNPLAEALARMLGMGTSPRAKGGGAGDEGAMNADHRTGRTPGTARDTPAPAPRIGAAAAARALGRRYPEWAAARGAYREDWCTVVTCDPFVADGLEPLAAESDLPLRRHLARLGMANAPHRRQAEGDALDVTALVDFAARRRSGSDAEPRVYEQRRRSAHDLGALVLLDASGSTGESAGGQEIFAGERRLAARLTAELEALGNRVATYAFASRGKDAVRFLRIKGFDEPFGLAARRRLAAVEPSGFTRLGAAVRHATCVLREEAGSANMLLVVLGDGLPYDEGYEHEHAFQDTRRALAEAVRGGVACACVALRSSTAPEILDRVWGHVAHCEIDAPAELAVHVRPVFGRALREAAAQRREVAA